MTGRGAHYKALYGGRGRGGGSANVRSAGPNFARQPHEEDHIHVKGHKRIRSEECDTDVRGNDEALMGLLRRLNGKSYPAYKDILGSWRYRHGILQVRHVQSDPYAPASKFRLQIQHDVAGFPKSLHSNSVRSVALCDYLTRRLYDTVTSHTSGAGTSGHWGAPKGGDVAVDKPGQQVLQRSSVVLDAAGIEARFTISLPARGRSILGDQAAEIFRISIPALMDSLLFTSQDQKRLHDFVDNIEDQECLRNEMRKAGLVAFIGNGALLPRASGASDEPMKDARIVPFQSPQNLEGTFNLPHGGSVSGMGILAGITMIAGGGFHGKSTLLDALSVGCYNHVPGDGREFVKTSSEAVSIQGEDGRSIKNVDISPFIKNLPGGVSTTSFLTQDASGSTSMAAGVIEALELGADTLLFDEDTCATNFLIKDMRMQRLISSDPITPLIFKVRAMLHEKTCSSILVIGGCGDYCDVADLVLEMRDYNCYDVTTKARQVCEEIPSTVLQCEETAFGKVHPRVLEPQTLPSGNVKMAARKRTSIDIGSEVLSLAKLPQLVHDSQTRAIVSALRYLAERSSRRKALAEFIQDIEEALNGTGMDLLMREDASEYFLARPRALEVGMAINRLRSVSLSYMS